VPQIAALKAGTASRRWLRRGFWVFDELQRQPWAGLAGWLNYLFLAEVVLYIGVVSRFARMRPELIAAYELVGSLDAATAVASMMARFPAHCAPTITEGSDLEIEDGCHPLLTRPVENSLTLHGRSALVTGSNMTGKTTFLKMIATNIILGRTLGVCLAQRAVIPAGPVMATIHGEHSIESGQSKYFAEVQAMLGFLTISRNGARGGGAPFVVIDEPFSGTNTIERVAAAKAVLAALSAGALVLAATHDGELQPMLAASFDAYHFSESPEVEGFFDYGLRAGPTRQTNALRLLAALGLPEDIVADAQAVAAALGREGR